MNFSSRTRSRFCKATASIKSFYYIDSVIRKIYSFSDLYCVGNFIYCFNSPCYFADTSHKRNEVYRVACQSRPRPRIRGI